MHLGINRNTEDKELINIRAYKERDKYSDCSLDK